MEIPFLGHGPPKVSDHLRLWLIAHEAPDVPLAAELAAMLPKDLRDWALDADNHGLVGWHGSVLHVDSGRGVQYRPSI